MNKTNVLVVGSGGREHALAWKLKQSPQAGTIYVAPGNPGTAMLGCINIPREIWKNDLIRLVRIVRELEIGLAVIGPEEALQKNIVGLLKGMGMGIPTFGPSEEAVLIECSKYYAKTLMVGAGIPTAPFKFFVRNSRAEAKEYVREKEGRVVIKKDGLSAGKGVAVCGNITEALRTIDIFNSGDIIIEDRLEGEEISVHALCDGKNVKLLPPVRDYKRLCNGNTGPMTGGMGAFGPVDVPAGFMEEIEQKIVLPCVRELARCDTPFVGCLYPGIMLTKDGPMVLEFNARFGDPEAQVYMRLLEDDVDLIEVLLACVHGRLNEVELRWRKRECICTVVASEGYGVENVIVGHPITVTQDLGVWYTPFHAGTAWENGQLITNGGRVMSMTKLTPPFSDPAERLSYLYGPELNQFIRFPGMQYRTDIGMV